MSIVASAPPGHDRGLRAARPPGSIVASAPPAEAVVTVEPHHSEELRMGATAMAPDQHERRFQSDIGDTCNHSDCIGTGCASFVCPCVCCADNCSRSRTRLELAGGAFTPR